MHLGQIPVADNIPVQCIISVKVNQVIAYTLYRAGCQRSIINDIQICNGAGGEVGKPGNAGQCIIVAYHQFTADGSQVIQSGKAGEKRIALGPVTDRQATTDGTKIVQPRQAGQDLVVHNQQVSADGSHRIQPGKIRDIFSADRHIPLQFRAGGIICLEII